jgi:hypothetical protein
MTVLYEYTSDTRVGCITIHVKLLLNVKLGEHGCSGEKLL